MKLESIPGMAKPTADKLRRAGVASVEQLATLDTRSLRITGLTHEKIVALRRDAQRALFHSALERVEEMAEGAASKAEKLLREATEVAVAAAHEARERAEMAMKQSQGMARVAAREAKKFERKVGPKAGRVLRQAERAAVKIASKVAKNLTNGGKHAKRAAPKRRAPAKRSTKRSK